MPRSSCRFIGSRAGAVTASVYTIVLAIPGSLWYLFRYVLPQTDRQEFKLMSYIAFALFAMVIVTSSVMVWGICMKTKKLFYPWVIVMIFVLLFDTGSASFLTSLHLDVQRGLSKWDSIGLVFYIFRMVTHVFALVCVHAYKRELSKSKVAEEEEPPPYMSNVEHLREFPPPPYTPRDIPSLSPPPYMETPLTDVYSNVVSETTNSHGNSSQTPVLAVTNSPNNESQCYSPPHGHENATFQLHGSIQTSSELRTDNISENG